MRISKKFSGYNMGKHTYVSNNMGFRSPVSVSSYSTFDDYVEPLQKVRRVAAPTYFPEPYFQQPVVTHLMPCDYHFPDTSPVWLSPSWSVNTPVAASLVDPETCITSTAESHLYPYLVSQAPLVVVEREVDEWKSFDEFVGVTPPYCTDDAHPVSNIPEDNDNDGGDEEWKSVLLHYCGNIFIGKNPISLPAFPVTAKNLRIAASVSLVTTSSPTVDCLSALSSYSDLGSTSCGPFESVCDDYVDAYYSDEEVLASLIDDL
jgi:hypothetical protein